MIRDFCFLLMVCYINSDKFILVDIIIYYKRFFFALVKKGKMSTPAPTYTPYFNGYKTPQNNTPVDLGGRNTTPPYTSTSRITQIQSTVSSPANTIIKPTKTPNQYQTAYNSNTNTSQPNIQHYQSAYYKDDFNNKVKSNDYNNVDYWQDQNSGYRPNSNGGYNQKPNNGYTPNVNTPNGYRPNGYETENNNYRPQDNRYNIRPKPNDPYNPRQPTYNPQSNHINHPSYPNKDPIHRPTSSNISIQPQHPQTSPNSYSIDHIFHLRSQIRSQIQSFFKGYQNTRLIPIPSIQTTIDTFLQESKQKIQLNIKTNSIKNNIYIVEMYENNLYKDDVVNLLLKKIAGEHVLQCGRSNFSMYDEMKISRIQFRDVINRALRIFLKINYTIDSGLADFIFRLILSSNNTNTDFIYFSQYYWFIVKYLCIEIPDRPKHIPINDIRGEFKNSKLRSVIWGYLRNIYDGLVQSKCDMVPNFVVIRRILTSFLGPNSSFIEFFLPKFIKQSWNTFELRNIAELFIKYFAKYRWIQWMSNNLSTYRQLNSEQFIILVSRTFSLFFKGKKIKRQYWLMHFKRIDLDNDNRISYWEYMNWIYNFVSVYEYYGSYYWLEEDDVNHPYNPFDNTDIGPNPTPKPLPDSSTYLINPFNFTDYSLAQQVKQKCRIIFPRYDQNKNNSYSKKQVNDILISLLQQSQTQISDAINNLHHHDKNHDNIISLKQLIDFMAEYHFGLLPIQRLHKMNFYSKAERHLMNFEEFVKTMSNAVQPLGFEPSANLLRILFDQVLFVDARQFKGKPDHTYINYSTYFKFLKFYFGQYKNPHHNDQDNKYPDDDHCPIDPQQQNHFYDDYVNYQPIDRFVRIIMDQFFVLCKKYDKNGNGLFDEEEAVRILREVFRFSQTQATTMKKRLFITSCKCQNRQLKFEQMISIVLSHYFIEIVFNRKYKNCNCKSWSKTLKLEEFISIIWESCSFLRFKPLKQDLKKIFIILAKNNETLSFKQYYDFINSSLGGFFKPEPQPKPDINEITKQQNQFYEILSSQVKRKFKRYDIKNKGYLSDAELKSFLRFEMDFACNQDIDDIFKLMYRYDIDLNEQFTEKQVVQLVLENAASINLNIRNQFIPNKSSISKQMLVKILTNTYKFLIPNYRYYNVIADIIFKKKGKNNAVSYKDYIYWTGSIVRNRKN